MSNVTNSLTSIFDQVTRQVKALRQTPLEKSVTDATSNDNWGVANSTLIQLARETSDYNSFAVIMKGIWEGLGDKREKWRRIYKSLVLLEYCIKFGSERVCNEARSEIYKIRPLHDFKFMEEGRDKGTGIRDKSKQITDLLTDSDQLRTERLKAAEGKDKYGGISSSGPTSTVTPSGYATATTNTSTSNETYQQNNTDKLEEYREKDRLRREQKSSPPASEPVFSSTGKMVVKPPAPTMASAASRKPTTTTTSSSLAARKSDSSSSSSSSEDSPQTTNLIDFDAPVVVPRPPPQVAPVHPVQQPQYPPPAQPFTQQVYNPYMQQPQQQQAYMQQPPQQYSNPYAQQSLPTNPYAQQAPVSNPYVQQTQVPMYTQQPAPYVGGSNPFGAPQQPVAGMGYPTFPQQAGVGGAYPSIPAPTMPAAQPRDTNPFGAFNGL